MSEVEKNRRTTGRVSGAAQVGRGARRVLTFALIGGSFALLIWMKLRVVTGVPRTAYADPDQHPKVNTPAKASPPESSPGAEQK